jgi:hypothetical protein
MYYLEQTPNDVLVVEQAIAPASAYAPQAQFYVRVPDRIEVLAVGHDQQTANDVARILAVVAGAVVLYGGIKLVDGISSAVFETPKPRKGRKPQ